MNRQQQIDHFVAQAHVLAMQRLRGTPSLVQAVKAQLARWRANAGVTRSDAYWNEWQALLDKPVDAIEQAVCADSDHALTLRSVSPMSVLITQAERMQLLRQTRLAA